MARNDRSMDRIFDPNWRPEKTVEPAPRVDGTPERSAAGSAGAEFFPGVEKTRGLIFVINNEEAPTGRSAGSLA